MTIQITVPEKVLTVDVSRVHIEWGAEFGRAAVTYAYKENGLVIKEETVEYIKEAFDAWWNDFNSKEFLYDEYRKKKNLPEPE